MVDLSKILFPYKKKVLESIEFNTFFTIKYWKFAKKVLDSILTGLFFHTGYIAKFRNLDRITLFVGDVCAKRMKHYGVQERDTENV